MKKILVTGGAGFIGTHLCEKLLTMGHYVICMDNFYTSKSDNVKHLEKVSPNFKFIFHDVINPFYFEVDEIYNLACPASPVHYQRDAINTIKTSVIGAINALDLARKLDIPILQTSTSEIYGDPLVHPQIESYWGNVNPIGVRSCYDESKRCAETLFFDYNRQYNVKIKVARLFNTYGPFMDPIDGRVVSNFIVQCLTGKDITIYGDGTQTRSFQYISDLINGLIKLMDTSKDFIGPVNLGNPNEFSILELAEKVIFLCGKIGNVSSNIVFKDLPSDDPKQRQPNISLAKSVLDWEPIIKLDIGLINTIEYFNRIIG